MIKLITFLQAYIATLDATLDANDNRRDRGAGIAEYALLVAGIAVVAAVAIAAFGGALATFFGGLADALGFG